MSSKVKPSDQQENNPCTNENVEIGGPLPAPDMIEDVSASGVATCLFDASPRVHGATSSILPFLQPQKLRLPVTAHTPAENHPIRHDMDGSICGLIGLRETGSSSIRRDIRIGNYI